MPAGTAKQRCRWMSSTAGVAAVAIGLTLLAGFLAGQYEGLQDLAKLYQPRLHAISTMNDAQPGLSRSLQARGPLRELTPPWGDPAAKLRDEKSLPALASGFAEILYIYAQDADGVSPEKTAAFLQQFRQQVAAHRQLNLSRPDLAVTVQSFSPVAKDILSYLRYHDSKALLLLLRQYSKQGSFNLTAADPRILRQEVQQLLNVTALGEWYKVTSQFDHGSLVSAPPRFQQSVVKPLPAVQVRDTRLAASATNQRQLAMTSAATIEDSLRNARQLYAAAAPPAQARQPASAVNNGSPVVLQNGSTTGPVLSGNITSMTLQQMLCAIKEFSPVGLKGLILSATGNTTQKIANFPCQQLPKLSLYRHKEVAFKPIKVPIVFHCHRFPMNSVLLPPFWTAEASAQNLLKHVNQLFKPASIQFELKEVRYDVNKYPYLLMGTLQDWQQCTASPTQEAAGFPCLAETAMDPSFAALTNDSVINIIVGGSTSPPFCNKTSNNTCKSIYSGNSGAYGPWFQRPSPTWTESSPAENWVFISWDMFTPYLKNSQRFWNGGAVTLAHELGHYLGLMHTHEGSQPCEGAGATLLSAADAVPDTPANRHVIQWAAQHGLAVRLASWCSAFRHGKQPRASDLLAFDSCKQAPVVVDNVFNIMSYLPNACCMLLTPGQVARLQWAIATFRPKMMARYAFK